MTRDELIHIVGRDIMRAYPWASDLGYVAHVATEIVAHGYATLSGDAVVYHDDARRKWPCIPAAQPAPPPVPEAAPPTQPAPTLEDELASVTGNDDRAKCLRAEIRTTHLEKEIAR